MTTGMHTDLNGYSRTSYWDGNSAVTSDGNWTHCRVELFGMYPCSHEFNNARDRDRFLTFMDHVYERGKSAAKRDIRQLLEIKG